MFYPVKRKSNVVYADPFAHIFEQFFEDATRGRPVESRLTPQFEIAENDDSYTVAAELPGLGKDNVAVVIDEDILTVRGEKKAEQKQEDETYILRERSYGTFERTFRLPDTVDQKAIAAVYENGVLTLTLPKKPEAKKPEPRQIKIKG